MDRNKEVAFQFTGWVIGITLLMVGAFIFFDIQEEKNAQKLASTRALFEKLDTHEANYDSLVSRFEYHKDDFANNGYYRHIDLQKRNSESYINVIINEGGRAHLSSYYQGVGIDHDRLSVLIGEDVYHTNRIDINNQRYRRTRAGSTVIEHVSFANRNDNGVLKAIAESNEDEIKVRFDGRTRNHDIILNKVEIAAIRDSYKFGEAMSQLTMMGRLE